MTTRAQTPVQYRATMGLIQLRLPDHKDSWQLNPFLREGDLVPGWALSDNVEYLLSMGFIEKVEAAS